MDATIKDVEDFLKGFLDGLHINADWTKLAECIQDGEQLLTDIEAVIEDIKNLSIHNWATVSKALADIIDVVKEITTKDIPECEAVVPEFAAFIARLKAMSTLDIIIDLGEAIVFHFSEIAHDIGLLTSSNWTARGFAIGDMLHLVVPKAVPQEEEKVTATIE